MSDIDPIQPTIDPIPDHQPALDAPEASQAGEGTPEAAAETPEQQRIARALAAATKKERRAAERERRASEIARQAEERAKAALEAQSAAEALFAEAGRDPAKARALLERAGFRSLDDLARLLIGIEPEPETPDLIAHKALERAERLEAQIQAEREQAERQRAAQHFEALQHEHLGKVHSVVQAAGDKYELIRQNNAEGEVLRRIYSLLAERQIRHVTPEEEVMLVNHFAEELEDELYNYAQTAFKKLSGIKKLSISTHTSSGTTPGSPNEITSNRLSTDAVEKAAQQIRTQKPSKFINEHLVSSKPTPRDVQAPKRQDLKLIEEAINAMKR